MIASMLEVKQELDATPSEIQCSGSGTVFATSDVRGSVKIYDYSQMVLIYKLTSDDIINAITFSPDSQRFYDLRGSYCNVWEPNCLLRTTEGSLAAETERIYSSEAERSGSLLNDFDNDEDDVRSVSLTLYASEAQVENRTAITAVATCADNQQLCAYVKEEGIIEIYDMERNKKHIIVQSAFGLNVDQVALSRNGTRIAYSVHNDHVYVKSLDLLSDPGKVKIGTIYAEETSSSRGAIGQLLFDRTTEHLFIYGTDKLQIISLADRGVVAQAAVELLEQHAQWENQRTNPDILLAFTTHSVRAYSWRTLELKFITPIVADSIDNTKPTSLSTVELLLPSHHPRMRLAMTSCNESGSKYFTFLILDTAALSSSPTRDTAIRGLSIPSAIADHIERPLSILQDGRLMFLDENLWVCTARLPCGPESKLKRHFFLPRDWLTSAGLLLCRIQADGALLCPSRGEMAVVKSEFGMDW